MKKVWAHTDGSVSRNGFPDARGGYAVILQVCDTNIEIEKSGYLNFDTDNCNVTNNRAELYAILLALESITKPCELIIFSDSEWSIKTINGEYAMRTNLDLFVRIQAETSRIIDMGCTVVFAWIRGHAGMPLNERVDKLAGKARLHPDTCLDEDCKYCKKCYPEKLKNSRK